MRPFLSSSKERAQFAPAFPDYVDAKSLAASIAERFTVPTGAVYVIFSATGNFYAKYGDNTVTATVPGDTADGTASELNPEAREIATTHVSVISPDAVVVTAAFYAK